MKSVLETKLKLTELSSKFVSKFAKNTNWFEQYRVDNIELWITGVPDTGTIITRLTVSAKETEE